MKSQNWFHLILLTAALGAFVVKHWFPEVEPVAVAMLAMANTEKAFPSKSE